MADSNHTFSRILPTTSPTEGYFSGVVVVAEIGARANTSWSDGSSRCWLRSLMPSMLDDPFVLEFEYGMPDDEFIWQYFARKGDLLAESLLEFVRGDKKVRLSSLVFICHGLGGLIVKKAVRRIHDEFHKPEFGRLLKLLSGVVFLGCPHPRVGEPDDWSKLSVLLKQSITLSKKTMHGAVETIGTVASICKAFNESDLDFGILSAFESKPTKVKGALFKRQILVNESLACTRTPREIIVKVDSTHSTLCNVSAGSPFYAQLSEFLTSTQIEATTSSSPVATTVLESAPAWSVSNVNEDEERFIQLSVPTLPRPLESSLGVSNQNTFASSSDRSGYEMVPGQQPVTGIAKRLKLPSYLMGPHTMVPEFCGRDGVLQQIWSALCSQEKHNLGPSSNLRTFAISAAGGMGKTQVAIAFAHQCKQQNEFDAIFWIQADDTGKLAQSFADIARKLGLEDSNGDQVVSRDLVLEWLSYPVHQIQEGVKYTPKESSTPRWLLVFDNADDLSILPDYWPITGGGSILVTSRDPLANSQTYFQCDAGIDLSPFDPEDAASLIRNLTGYSDSKNHDLSAAIAKRLSYIPLAVNQMAKTIKRRNMSLKEFFKHYEQAELRQSFNETSIGNPRGSGGAPRTIATVWSLEDLQPAAARLFDVISFMDPDQIQESLLTESITNGSGGTRSLLPDYPASLSSFLLARSELNGSSLLSRNVDTKELTTHRIIQDTNRLQMSPDHFTSVFNTVCQRLYEAWPFSEFDWESTRWAKCEPIVAHIDHLGEIYKGAIKLSLDSATTAQLSRLLMDAGWYYVERGLYKQAPRFFDLSEQICELAPQETIITMADICYCRAELHNMRNDAKSGLPFAKKYLALVEENDPQGWRLPQAHNITSTLLLDVCDFEGAVYHADLAVTLYSRLPIPEYVAFAYINKAYGLLLLGRHEEAERVLTGYLEGRPGQEKPVKGEPYKAAYAMRLLGAVLRRQGRLPESFAMLKEATKLLIDTTGEDFRVGEFHDQLGNTHKCLQEFKEAKFSYRRAIELWNEKPEYFLEISRAYFKLSHICEELGETREALDAKKNGERLLGKVGDNLTEKDLDNLMPGWGRI